VSGNDIGSFFVPKPAFSKELKHSPFYFLSEKEDNYERRQKLPDEQLKFSVDFSIFGHIIE
jgi:hypothetical protein